MKRFQGLRADCSIDFNDPRYYIDSDSGYGVVQKENASELIRELNGKKRSV
jgi:hypothetical protein